MSFTEGLFLICSSAIYDMIIDTKHSFISSAGCHCAERISWDLETPLCGLTTTGECLYTAMSNPRPTCGPVSFSLLCMYNTTTAWL